MALSDESWFIEKATTCAMYDSFAAKAWLLTGKTLFPQSLLLQFELYKIEKERKRVVEVARLLEEMIQRFPHETVVKQEVMSIVNTLQDENTDDKMSFLKSVFTKLPAVLQCSLLLQVASEMKDIIHHTRLMMLILTQYPDTVPIHGIQLADALLQMERKLQVESPLNIYRKYLVCDVLPLVLRAPLPTEGQKSVVDWLQKAVEFLVVSAVRSSHSNSGSRSRGGEVTGESGLHVTSPWQRLQELMMLAATQLSWPQMSNKTTSVDIEMEWLQSVAMSSPHSHQAVLYCAVVLLLRCIYNYTKHVNPMLIDGSSQVTPLVLFMAPMDCLCEEQTEPPSSKRPHTDNALPVISCSKSITVPNDILLYFITALKCWKILHISESLTKEFQSLCASWRTDTWAWLHSFRIDALIYEGSLSQATAELESQHEQNEREVMFTPLQTRQNVQLAVCYYNQQQYQKSLNLIVSLLQQFSPTTQSSVQFVAAHSGSRHLHMLSCQHTELLPFIVHFLILALKEKLTLKPADDQCLGHLIVLLQYDWPRYASTCKQLLEVIRTRKTFTYASFFSYVINIDLLEEFACLRIPELGAVNLNILPAASKTAAQIRTVTRGVNKGVKEDFKIAFEKQVSRCSDNIDFVLKKFVITEFASLLDALS